MVFIPASYPGVVASLDNAQLYKTINFSYYRYADNPGTYAGVQASLIEAMSAAKNRQFLMIGNGSTGMTIDVAKALVANPNGTPITSPLETQRLNLAIGMVTYFTNIPAMGSSSNSIAFAVGGLNIDDSVEVLVEFCGQAATGTATLSTVQFKNVNSSTQIGGLPMAQPGNQPIISLNSSNQILLQDGTTTLTYGTNTIVVCQAYGVIFGSLNVVDGSTWSTDFGANVSPELYVRFK